MASKVIIQQPKPLVVDATSDQWSTSICECESVNECCFSVWCFPCFACITARDHGECLCLPLLDTFGIIPPVTLSMRVSMRKRYGITVRTAKTFSSKQLHSVKFENLSKCLQPHVIIFIGLTSPLNQGCSIATDGSKTMK
uniref:Plac8 onzin related protein 2 n=1 Tax=Pygocentrus nattereri TaxID=42514 RepID=A0AAR2KYM4_PYGNA